MHVVPINVLEHRLSFQRVEQWLLKQRVEHQILNQRVEHEPPTLYEYAWTQQLNQQQRTTSTA